MNDVVSQIEKKTPVLPLNETSEFYKYFNAMVTCADEVKTVLLDCEQNNGLTPKLQELLSIVKKLNDYREDVDALKVPYSVPDPKLLWNRPIDEFELKSRTVYRLKGIGIYYIGTLVQKTESGMLDTSQLDKKSLKEIKEVLLSKNLALDTNVGGWEAPLF